MKLTRVLIILMCMSLCTGIIHAQGAIEDITTTFIRNANIRQIPNETGTLLTIATRGQQFRIDGRTDSGQWLRGITANGTIGWAINGTLNLSLSTINSIRIITPDMPFLLTPPEGASAPAPSNAPAPTSGLEVRVYSDVNMRGGPGTGFPRVGGVFGGKPLLVDGRNNDSTWVRGANVNGEVGWVAVRFVNISTDQLNGLPIIDENTPFALQIQIQAQPAPNPPAPAPVVAVASTTPIRGFSYGGHIAGFNDTTLNWMRYAGMTWVKKQIRYYDGQNPNDVAHVINQAHAAGFRILIGLVGDKGELTREGYYGRYASFASGVAALGADAIEVWNEPNLDREWTTGNINPADYTELLRQAFNAIKANNRNTLVISAAPAPTGAEAAFPGAVMNDDRYIRGMAAAGAANYMDCIGVHYNEGIMPPTATSGDPREPSNYFTRYLPSMINVYHSAFRGARPLCFTELGYLTPEGYGSLPPNFSWASNVTLAQQAAWVDGAVAYARNTGRVRIVIIWNMDFRGGGDDPMGGYAIIRPDGSCPACDALAR